MMAGAEEPWLGVEEASLELRALGGSGEGYDVPDVGDAGHELDGTLKPQAKARVRNGAVASEVQVPGIFIMGDA